MAEIVHFVHALNDRTIADVVCRLAEEMQHAGRQTTIVAASTTPDGHRPEGVEVLDLGGSGRRTLSTTRLLARALRTIAPTTVFAHAEGPARTALLATRTSRPLPSVIGVVHNHHSSYQWSHPLVRRAVDRLLLPRLDALVGVSPGVAEDLAATFPAAAHRVHMIPPPLTRWATLPQLAAEPIDHPWFHGPRPIVVTVGHMHPRKDHATLVRAVARLRDHGGVFPRLAIIGSDSGEHADSVRALIAQLRLEQEVALLGVQPNPIPYVAGADVFVLSSRNEGLPVTLLEAMSVGTPIVSTDAPSGPRWGLDDGRAGLLTPVGDPAALATAIEQVLADPALQQRLIDAGRTRAASFSPSDIARQHLDLAESLR